MTLKTKRKFNDKWYGLYEFEVGEKYTGRVTHWWINKGWEWETVRDMFTSRKDLFSGDFRLPEQNRRWAVIEMAETENEFGVVSP